MQTSSQALVLLLVALLFAPAFVQINAAPHHTVVFGAARKAPYSPPEGAPPVTELSIRALLVDGTQKEWTTGSSHAVTDRSFVIRRVLRLNDSLPSDSAEHWIWQPGPWLLVDRISGRITALRLPYFDPGISDIVWFRDFAAYCGVADTAKGGLFAVVAQLGARRYLAQQQFGKWPPPKGQSAHLPSPVCQPAQWQRKPNIRAAITPTGGDTLYFDIVGQAAVIIDGEIQGESTEDADADH